MRAQRLYHHHGADFPVAKLFNAAIEAPLARVDVELKGAHPHHHPRAVAAKEKRGHYIAGSAKAMIAAVRLRTIVRGQITSPGAAQRRSLAPQIAHAVRNSQTTGRVTFCRYPSTVRVAGSGPHGREAEMAAHRERLGKALFQIKDNWPAN